MKQFVAIFLSCALLTLPLQAQWGAVLSAPRAVAAPSGIALLSHASAQNSGNVTTAGITTNATGNLLIAVVTDFTSAGAATVSDSYSNTWHALTTQSTTMRGTIYYSYNAVGGSGHTCSALGGTFVGVAFAAFSGALTSGDPFDVQNGTDNTASTTIQPGSITPNQNNELIIAGLAMYSGNDGSTFTLSGGMVTGDIIEQLGNIPGSFGVALAYKVQTTATAINPTWSSGGGILALDAMIASFKAP